MHDYTILSRNNYDLMVHMLQQCVIVNTIYGVCIDDINSSLETY